MANSSSGGGKRTENPPPKTSRSERNEGLDRGQTEARDVCRYFSFGVSGGIGDGGGTPRGYLNYGAGPMNNTKPSGATPG